MEAGIFNLKRKQKGVVLILTLVFLMGLSILVLDGLQSSVLQIKLSSMFKKKLNKFRKKTIDISELKGILPKPARKITLSEMDKAIIKQVISKNDEPAI